MAVQNITTEFVKVFDSLTTVNYNINLSDGSKKEIVSPILNDKSNLNKKLTEVIDHIIISLGLFSSRKIGFDDFDNVKYDEDDLLSYVIEGSTCLHRFPHNIITCHKKNWWKMCCLNVAFRTLYNIIPNKFENQTLYAYHDLPEIFNFERHGNVTEGRLLINEGIKIHKSKSRNDTFDQFYVRVNFVQNNVDYFKDINLINILNHTPTIKTVNFYFKLIDDSSFAHDSKEFEDIKFYNMLQSKWIINVLTPMIEQYCTNHNINNNFEIRYF